MRARRCIHVSVVFVMTFNACMHVSVCVCASAHAYTYRWMQHVCICMQTRICTSWNHTGVPVKLKLHSRDVYAKPAGPFKKQHTKLSFAVAKQTHTHTCTLSQTCLAMMNAQPCLIGKTHTQACTRSFSAILECAGRPLRIHKRANSHTRTHTYAPDHDTEKQHTEACSLHANTHECSISHSNCFRGTLKQQVPEHSMQCAQCSRRDHLSLPMLECIMVLCVWLECRQRQRWASCHAFYAHAPMTQMK